MSKFLVIDNYDSFVHNLARYIELAGHNCDVVRNDAITPEEVKTENPGAIILSPGPCTPKEAGICIDLIKSVGAYIPVLGVCLGHQCIAEAYGGKTIRAGEPVHGKGSILTHDGKGLFTDIPSPMIGGRYHSLVSQLPADSPLTVTAQNNKGEIMAMQHKTHPVYGLQFHPESILTDHGLALITNFSAIALEWGQRQWNRRQEAA